MELSATKLSSVARERAAPYLAVEDQVPMMQYLMQRVDSRSGLKLTLDIDDFQGKTTVAVMPYDGMQAEDEVEVIFQAFVTAEQPIGRLPEMRKTLSGDDIGKPIVFMLQRADLLEPENLVGFYASFYFKVTPRGGESRKSITQSVQILLADPAPERVETPRFEHDVGTVLYPSDHPDGVSVIAQQYVDMQINDIALLFDSDGGVADWQFVTKVESLKFTLSQDWLKDNLNKNALTLQMHYGRGNRGLRSLPMPVKVANERVIEGKPELPATLTFYTARTGLAVTIPERTDIGGGNTVMHIVGADNIPLLRTEVFKELNGRKVFTFAPSTLDVILGVKTHVFFVYTSAQGVPLPSDRASLEVNLPGTDDLQYFPRLQCLKAQGLDKLSLPLRSKIELELGGWPLMAKNQWVRIFLTVDENPSILIVDRAVTEQEAERKLFAEAAILKDDIVSGTKIKFATTLFFNVVDKKPDDKRSAKLNELSLNLVSVDDREV